LEFARVPLNHLRPETTIHQIGLDSISAIQLAAKIRDLKGIKISAADILQKPAISDLADLVQSRKGKKDLSSCYDFDAFELQHKPNICEQFHLKENQIERVRPCTPLQTGLISQFLNSKSLYVNHVTYEMDSSWTSEKLSHAWFALSKAHDMLRTGFALLDDTAIPFAMVTYRESISSEQIDISHTATKLEKWRNDRTVQFHRNLRRPPWAVLIEEAEGRLLMHLTIFHGLYDAHSLDLILKDLNAKDFAQLKPAPINFVLGELMMSARGEEVSQESSSHYWKKVLGDAVMNQFPSLTPLISTSGSTNVSSRLCSRTLRELENSCRQEGITLQAVGQAAWARLLSAYIGEPAVTFGVVLSGRDTIVGAEQVAFPCITTVPIPAMDSGDNWKLLTNMMQLNSQVRKHQFTSIKDIQRWTNQTQPLFDTIFAFQKSSHAKSSASWTAIEEKATAEVCLLVSYRSLIMLLIQANF
jgi:aryl carrier-like protein